MAIRTTDQANRLMTESVLLTLQLKARLESDPAIDEDRRVGIPIDTGMMAATLASTLIATFGGSILSRSLFEEVDDAEVAPAAMVPAGTGATT